MTRYFFLMVIFSLAVISAPAFAGLQYYPDPVYRKLNAEDVVPMQDIIDMAGQGDVRAQFIMGDLYSKGKGGLEKNIAESRRWFEISAMHGYNNSFMRLAAMAKRAGNAKEAWQWYTLAINGFGGGAERKFGIQARDLLVETEKMTREDIREARKAMRAWEDKRDDQLRAERDAAREENRKAAPDQKKRDNEAMNQSEALENVAPAAEAPKKEPTIIIDTNQRTIIVGEEDEQN